MAVVKIRPRFGSRDKPVTARTANPGVVVSVEIGSWPLGFQAYDRESGGGAEVGTAGANDPAAAPDGSDRENLGPESAPAADVSNVGVRNSGGVGKTPPRQMYSPARESEPLWSETLSRRHGPTARTPATTRPPCPPGLTAGRR